jgi:hypothetical protein
MFPIKIGNALNIETHKVINEYIAKTTINGFSLDSYLDNNLNMPDGINSTFNLYSFNSAWELLRNGGEYEDAPPENIIPFRRSRNHFHNPLKSWPWNQAGAGYTGTGSFCDIGFCPLSAILWAYGPQNSDPVFNPGGDWSWLKTREYFYKALTSTTLMDRDYYFANTFRGLGQVMHLLEDMSVPDHTRNSFHPFDAGRYEGWAKRKVTMENISSYFPDNSQIFAGNINSIASFFDMDQYDGTNPEVTRSNTAGLAEYTSANFFTPDTIFSPDFPNPNWADMYSQTIQVEAKDGRIDNVIYLFLNGQSHALAMAEQAYLIDDSLLTLVPAKWKYNLDDKVYKDYASVLLPRAIGYSAGLMSYFFRGMIDVQFDSEASSHRSIRLTARNTTANGDPMSWGDVYLVVRYHELQEYPNGTIGYATGDYQYKVYQLPYITSIPGPSVNPLPLTFDLSSNPLPLHISDVTLQLVYKGYLGNEGTAVAVGNAVASTLATDIYIAPPTNGVYTIASDNVFNNFALTAKTNIPGGLVDPNGIIELEVEFREATSDPFASQLVDTMPADASTYYFRVPERDGINNLPQGDTVELNFDLSGTPLPLWATDVYVSLLYRRATDPETQLIAFGRRDVSEPTPVDILNNSDKICIYGQWYDSGSVAAFHATGDNAAVNIQPLPIQSYHYYASLISDPTPFSPANYVFSDNNLLAPGVYRRLGYILTDYSFKYGVYSDVTNMGTAIKNQVIDDQGTRFYYPIPILRGIRMWSGAQIIFILPPYPLDSVCDFTVLPLAGQ